MIDKDTRDSMRQCAHRLMGIAIAEDISEESKERLQFAALEIKQIALIEYDDEVKQ